MSFRTCMLIAVPHTEQLGSRDSKFLCWNQAIWLSRSPKITGPRSFRQKCTVARLFYPRLPLIGQSVIICAIPSTKCRAINFIEHSLLQCCDACCVCTWIGHAYIVTRFRIHVSFAVSTSVSGKSGPWHCHWTIQISMTFQAITAPFKPDRSPPQRLVLRTIRCGVLRTKRCGGERSRFETNNRMSWW